MELIQIIRLPEILATLEFLTEDCWVVAKLLESGMYIGSAFAAAPGVRMSQPGQALRRPLVLETGVRFARDRCLGAGV